LSKRAAHKSSFNQASAKSKAKLQSVGAMIEQTPKLSVGPMIGINAARTQLIFSLMIILLVCAMGVSLALQGWRSRIPTFDLLPFIERAHELVVHGSIPDRGGLTSLSSFIPPGIAWLLVPGVLLFRDPRLFEYVAATILYGGTLLGIFLLARNYFGQACAFLAVGLYAFSELGLHYASSLWPRGHPFFYVWMVYWTLKWVKTGNGKFFVLAIVSAALGMYVFMEIAPALLIVPAMWIVYRPRLQLWPVLVGSGLALVIWYPYLHFQLGRGLVDIESQFLRKWILPTSYKDSWCDQNLILSNLDASPVPIEDKQIFWREDGAWTKTLNLAGFVGTTAKASVDKLLSSNFRRVARLPGASVTIMFLVLSSIGVAATTGAPNRAHSRDIFWLRFLFSGKTFALGLLLAGLLANEWIIARWLSPDGVLEVSTLVSIRAFQLALILTALVLLQWRRIAAVATRLPRFSPNRSLEYRENARPLVLSLVIPWLVLLLFAENDHEKRFWWLWPLQIIFLAAIVGYIVARLKTAWIRWVVELGLIFVLWDHPLLLSRLDSWLKTGWAGADADQIQVIDYVAARLRAERKDQAAIGYQTFIGGFEVMNNVLDAGYKVGAEFDLLFKQRQGISNIDHCAEGISTIDEYRVLQTKPNEPESEDYPLAFSTKPPFRYYFNTPADSKWKMMAEFGIYRVFSRERLG
jgi:hypothetical protein